MARFIISGCNRKMGNQIAAKLKTRPNCITATGIDAFTGMEKEFPVFSTPADISCETSILISLSSPSLLPSLLEPGFSRRIPMVICTVGYPEDQVTQIKRTAQSVLILYSDNVFPGVSLPIELTKKAAFVLWGQFDVEVTERHHDQKTNTPSGTALMITNTVPSIVEERSYCEYSRYSQRKKRSKAGTGLYSVRGSAIAEEHEVLFADPDGILSITRSAQSKEIFATDSISAALFLVGKPAGLCNIGDLLVDHKEES